tara:strand:+ start:4382 stop:4696 length:315 start_codon:yes stop_codon:yes gene_type:complete
MSVFGSYLAAQREKLGLTQRQVASEIGISQPAYQAWETGKASPTVKHLCRLQKTLKVNGDVCLDLMGMDITPVIVERACVECDSVYKGGIYCPKCGKSSGEPVK